MALDGARNKARDRSRAGLVILVVLPRRLVESRSHHNVPDWQPRSSVRDAIRLRRLTLRIAAGAVHLPLVRHRVQIAPEVRRDRIVRHLRKCPSNWPLCPLWGRERITTANAGAHGGFIRK